MYNYAMEQWQTFLQNNTWIVVLMSIWEVAWKGLALWRAGKNEAKIWFVAILVLNTVGIVPIAYLLIDRYKKRKQL